MTTPAAAIGIQKRQLGNELRKLREVTGLTQEQAAEHLGKAANKISRVENGKVGISKTDLDELLRLYQASEKDALWCRELAAGARRRRTRATGETTLYLGPKWFRAFRDFEQGASQIMQVGSEIVPGNLQTENYTRAMFLGQGNHPDHQSMENTVRVRRDRQALLTRENAAQFTGPRRPGPAADQCHQSAGTELLGRRRIHGPGGRHHRSSWRRGRLGVGQRPSRRVPVVGVLPAAPGRVGEHALQRPQGDWGPDLAGPLANLPRDTAPVGQDPTELERWNQRHHPDQLPSEREREVERRVGITPIGDPWYDNPLPRTPYPQRSPDGGLILPRATQVG